MPIQPVAYHGTKLLGGSEEDAQTANFNGTLDWNSLVGKTFEDRAFVSTSVERETAFKGEVRWEINAPKGSKGGMVNTFSMFPNENELLLPRNSKFLIKGIDKVDKNINLNVALIE